ncbi:MAG: hypothetical protein Cons2KO_01910 [Congregibacter sp.]
MTRLELSGRGIDTVDSSTYNKKLMLEAAAIVGSILLAFAIDAWWESRQRAEDELSYLELILRDLEQARETTNRFISYTDGAAKAALRAYAALSKSGPYDREVIRRDLLSVDRMTLTIPTAGYTEILSTGNLNVISDRALRDSIVRFYESAKRAQLILEKNNDAYLDGLLINTYFGEGLLLPYLDAGVGHRRIGAAFEDVNAALGADFEHREELLWTLSDDSREWNKLRSVLLWASMGHSFGSNFATELEADTDELAAKVRVQLNNL